MQLTASLENRITFTHYLWIKLIHVNHHHNNCNITAWRYQLMFIDDDELNVELKIISYIVLRFGHKSLGTHFVCMLQAIWYI